MAQIHCKSAQLKLWWKSKAYLEEGKAPAPGVVELKLYSQISIPCFSDSFKSNNALWDVWDDFDKGGCFVSVIWANWYGELCHRWPLETFWSYSSKSFFGGGGWGLASFHLFVASICTVIICACVTSCLIRGFASIGYWCPFACLFSAIFAYFRCLLLLQ